MAKAKAKVEKAAIEIDDVWVMLLSTIRYSIGRSSYMPGLCRDMYHRYSRYLTEQRRSQIAEEIETELKTRRNTTLGPGIDHRMWQQLANEIRQGPNAITSIGAIDTGDTHERHSSAGRRTGRR